MLDRRLIRRPQTGQVIHSPPRREIRPADPCALVLFGATGDLTKRLLMPELYNLSRTKMLQYDHTGKGRGTYAFLSRLLSEFLKHIFVKTYSKSFL